MMTRARWNQSARRVIPALFVGALSLALVGYAPTPAAAANDTLRLTNGRELLIRPGWRASYREGWFRFVYVRPKNLTCTMPLQDVVEIVGHDGVVYRNTYDPPAITFSNRTILNVNGVIVTHQPRYPLSNTGATNQRGWNSRTGRYE